MQDIKPDTSLYTALPNKLRAMALILETGSGIQWSCRGTWETITVPISEVMLGLKNGVDYRAKPKPRELWAVCRADGSTSSNCAPRNIFDLKVWDANYPESAPHSVVRFVEQPE